MKKIALISTVGVSTLLLAVPLVAFGAANFDLLTGIVSGVKGIVESIPPILVGVAVIYFLWGIVKFVGAGDDEEKRKAAKHIITYGLIGILVMVALWGIIEALLTMLGIEEGERYGGELLD